MYAKFSGVKLFDAKLWFLYLVLKSFSISPM